MILIAAIGTGGVIGSGKRMPWNVPEEYAQFLRLIRGQAVLIGRRSWEIFGRDLTSARNFVISRSPGPLRGATVVDGIEPAVRQARATGLTVFSAGGAQIYRETLPLADRLYLSTIKGEFEGDAYFPRFDRDAWIVTTERDHPRFTFRIWERRPTGTTA